MAKEESPRPFTVDTISAFRTLNVNDHAMSIADDEAQILIGMVPVGRSLRTARSYDNSSSYVLPSTGKIICIIDMGSFLVAFNQVDGKLYKCTSGSATPITGGTGFTGPKFEVWQGNICLITDPGKGYYSYDGTTLTAIDTTALGKKSCIAVFKKRVFLASGKSIVFTAPSTYNDFNAANGAGAITDNLSSIKLQINALVATQNYLYVIGDEGTHLIYGLQMLDDAITTFNLDESLPGIGTVWSDTVQKFGDEVYLANHNGVFRIFGSSATKISDSIAPYIENANLSFGFFAEMHGKIMYCISVFMISPLANVQTNFILCYFNDRWFMIAVDTATTAVNSIHSVCQASNKARMTSYAVWGFEDNYKLIELFSITNNLQDRYVRTKSYGLGSVVKDKAIIKAGVSIGGLAHGSVATLQPKLKIVSNITSSQVTALPDDQHDTNESGKDDVMYAKEIEGRGKGIAVDYYERSSADYFITAFMLEGYFGASW